MHAVIETPEFISDAKAAGITEEERYRIVCAIGNNPVVGDEIKGTGGARKVRFGGRGKGKSGGYRVITFYTDQDVPVFSTKRVCKRRQGSICLKPNAMRCARIWRDWPMTIDGE